MAPRARLRGRYCAVVGALACACFADVPDARETTLATSGAATTSTSGEGGSSSGTSGGGEGSSGGTGSGGETTGTGSTTGPPDPVMTCPDAPQLVLCYELEAGWAGGILIDSADAAHHGFMMDVSQVAGHKGSAASMSGPSRVYVTYEGTVFSRLQDAFTVGGWFSPSAGVASGGYGLVSREGHFALGLVVGDTYKVACTTPFTPTVLLSQSDLKPDAWTHVACVYDGQTLGLWVNGALESETAVDITSIGNKVMWIGNLGPDPSENAAFVGLVDEVQLWEIALKSQALCTAAGIEPCGGPA